MVENVGSLLGDAFSQAAQIRQRRERRDERDYMKKQLLYSFAAPIVSSAGQGLVNFAGDLILGNESKDFFSTREGNSLLRRVKDTRSALKSLTDQRSALMEAADGGSLYDGAEQIFKRRQREEALGKFATLGPEAEAQIKGATYTLTDDQRQAVHAEVDELLEGIRNLEAAPEDAEILRRYKQTPLSRNRAQKLFGKAARFFTGRDYDKAVKDPSLQLILTGGDLEVINSDWYKMITSDENFGQSLNNYIKQAAELKPDTFTFSDMVNATEEAVRSDPNLRVFSQLNERLRTRREAALEGYQIEEKAEGNARIAAALSSLKKAGMPITFETVSSEIIGSVGGVEKVDQAATIFFRSNPTLVEEIQNSLAKRDFGLDYNDASVSSANRADIDTAIKNRIEEAYTFFNSQLIQVKDQLLNLPASDPKKIKFIETQNIVTPAGISNLADEFVLKLFTEHMPRREEQVFQRGLMDALPIVGKGDVSVPTGFVERPEELRQIIENAFIDPSIAHSNERKADDTGITRRIDEEKTGTTQSLNINIFTAKDANGQTTVDILEEIASDVSLLQEERKQKIERALSELENSIMSQLSQSGFDSVPSQVINDIETLRKRFLGERLIGGRSRGAGARI